MENDRDIGFKARGEARDKVLEHLEKSKKVSIAKVVLRLHQALNAKETKFFQHEGKVIDERAVIAHGIRLKAVQVALDLHDAMPAERHELLGHVNMTPSLTPEDRVMLTNVSERVVNAIINKHRRDIAGS